MIAFRSEDTLVGLVALGLVPWIGAVLYRGLRDARLPIGRGYVDREERPGTFRVLTALYAIAAVAAGLIAADLLLGVANRGNFK